MKACKTRNTRLVFCFVVGILFLGQLSSYAAYAQEAQAPMSSPRCYSDADCQQPGMKGICQNPGQPVANCIYQEVLKVDITVITSSDCRTCRTDVALKNLNFLFPGLNVTRLDANDERAKEFIKNIHIELLPAYLFSKQVEKDPNFARFKNIVESVGEYYYLKPSFAGVSYFLGRERVPGKVDLFLLIAHPGASSALSISQELNNRHKDKIKFQMHLLGTEDPETGEFVSPVGSREINEDALYACVGQSNPDKAGDYLSCRTNDIETLWWEDCAVKNGVDSLKIKECARGKDINKLLIQKSKLASELRITNAPVFLFDNVEIFGITPQTTVAELEGFLKLNEKDTQKKQ